MQNPYVLSKKNSHLSLKEFWNLEDTMAPDCFEIEEKIKRNFWIYLPR